MLGVGLEKGTFTFGRDDGTSDIDGASVGASIGASDGASVNACDGACDGACFFASFFASIGASDGACDGAFDADGALDGASNAATVDFPFLAALDDPAFLAASETPTALAALDFDGVMAVVVPVISLVLFFFADAVSEAFDIFPSRRRTRSFFMAGVVIFDPSLLPFSRLSVCS